MKAITCKCGHLRIVFTGKELRSYRLKKGFTLRKLAGNIGCSVSFLSDCEKDRRNLSMSMQDYFTDFYS